MFLKQKSYSFKISWSGISGPNVATETEPNPLRNIVNIAKFLIWKISKRSVQIGCSFIKELSNFKKRVLC